jgi:hypothetical protein
MISNLLLWLFLWRFQTLPGEVSRLLVVHHALLIQDSRGIRWTYLLYLCQELVTLHHPLPQQPLVALLFLEMRGTQVHGSRTNPFLPCTNVNVLKLLISELLLLYIILRTSYATCLYVLKILCILFLVSPDWDGLVWHHNAKLFFVYSL